MVLPASVLTHLLPPPQSSAQWFAKVKKGACVFVPKVFNNRSIRVIQVHAPI